MIAIQLKGKNHIINEKQIAEVSYCNGEPSAPYGIRVIYASGYGCAYNWASEEDRDAVYVRIIKALEKEDETSTKVAELETKIERMATLTEALVRGAAVAADAGAAKENTGIDTALLGPMTTKELNLSSRSYNALMRRGIKKVSDLLGIKYGVLINIRSLGHKSVEEVVNKVHDAGLVFADSQIEAIYGSGGPYNV